MSFVLSSYNLLPLSAHISQIDFSYINRDRLFSDNYTLTSIDGVSYRQYDSLLTLKDVAINDNSIVFLTSERSLSSILNNLRTISSTLIGFSGIEVFSKYFWNLANTEKNRTVDIDRQYNIKTNFLLTIPYKSAYNYNIIPLKSSQGVNYEYDYNEIIKGSTARQYDGIYLDSKNNLFCQYRTSAFPVEILNDLYNTIYIPDIIPTIAISSLNFENFGANWGNSPCNSDVILLDRFGYENYTNSGKINKNYNGLPLCLWLSGNSANYTSSASWVERWYDPNRITQGNAFIAVVNTTTTSALNPIIDIPSTAVIYPKSKISYLRLGENRNLTFIDNFSTNLQFYLSSWGNKIEDAVNHINGFAIPIISDEMYPEGNFDGSLHFHIPPNDNLLIYNNLTLGLWVYQDQWDCGIDTQYFGNFSNNEGYGLFFNTGANAELLTLPSTSGFVYGFNNRGHRIFEKSINESMGLSSSRIDHITTDIFGSRWLYDDINKFIYKLSTDDLLTEVITLPLNAEINKMQINSQNELYVLNTTNNTISGFDIMGVLKYGAYSASACNNFEIDSNDLIHPSIADVMQIDKDNNVIKALGINLYKNDVLFYNIGYRVLAMNVDSDNNIWVVYNFNKVLKLNSDGKKLMNITLPLPFSSETSIELNFVKEIKNNCDKDYVWLVYNTNNYIIKLDSDGKILKYLNIRDVVNLKSCRDFFLNVKGDFTGFNTKRKFNKFSNGDPVETDNPALSVKINLKCGINKSTTQLHTQIKDLRGWNHFAFSHSISNDKTYIRLYVNGTEKHTAILNGIYFIDYGSKVSPFIIGGKSGKLGATNVEVGLNEEQYFVGKINDVRIYNTNLNNFQLRGLASNLYYDGWKSMTWYIPTPERTYMEEIVGYHLHAYKGSKSNKFNIKIKNMQITDENTQSIISDAITSSIKRLTPINTELNEIIFE